jgi:hypothetical protein
MEKIKNLGLPYDFSKSIYKGRRKKLEVICKKHGSFWTTPSNIYIGHKCPYCSGNRISTVDFIDKAKKLHGNRYSYALVECKRSDSKVKIICNKHGVFYQKPIDHLKGFSCYRCSESRAERRIASILDALNISYIREKKFEGCTYKSKLRFDFYLPVFNACIEFDGPHHFRPVDNFGGVSSFIGFKIRDSIKDRFCKENNIPLLRIDYRDYSSLASIVENFIKMRGIECPV